MAMALESAMTEDVCGDSIYIPFRETLYMFCDLPPGHDPPHRAPGWAWSVG